MTNVESWVIASGNKGKLAEFSELFKSFSINVLPQHEFEVPDVEETGLSFIENAIIKARNAAAHTGLPSIADDSGLEVDALQGRPGIYSARFSRDECGDSASDQTNNQKLLRLLDGVQSENRAARFACALAFMRHAKDPTPVVCCGYWRGRILAAPQGDNGFGYDPLFYIDEYQCTSAELPAQQKNSVSHRAIAMQKLLNALQDEKII